MRTCLSAVIRFLRSEDGPTAVEYAVMLAMIILICFVAIRGFGTTVSTSFSVTASMMP